MTEKEFIDLIKSTALIFVDDALKDYSVQTFLYDLINNKHADFELEMNGIEITEEEGS